MQTDTSRLSPEFRKLVERLQELGWYHSIELPGGEVIPGLQSLDQLRWRIAQFPIPQDLRGKRVLDIGAWDGWFSFEMERRGAEVMAVDSTDQTRFRVAKELLHSKVEYRIEDVCRLDPREIGCFDIVLFFGVLYHLKHPLLALERVCELTREMACVESYVTDDPPDPAAFPALEFYETTELRGQFDNWCGPNTACLLALCRTAGFVRVSLESVAGNRAHATCRRRWEEVPAAGAPPRITSVENTVTKSDRYSPARDDYVSIWFESSETGLTRENVCPMVGPFASGPVGVHSMGGSGWHTSCKLPPGLEPGWHDVRLRTNGGAWSTPVRIGVDLAEDRRRRVPEAPDPSLRIAGVTDGRDFEPRRVRAGQGSCLSAWVAGIPAGAALEQVRLRLNGSDLPATWLSTPDEHGLRQVNAVVPSGIPAGPAVVTVAIGGSESAPVEIALI